MATLTVGDLTPRQQYTATSGQTVFSYNFPIFENSDLKVYVGSTLKTLTTNYTVSGAGTTSGGNVTLTSGATTGDIITIYRDLPVSRTTDYATGGALLAENLNDDLDKLVMMIQQVEYDLNSRTLRFGQFTTGIPLSEFTESDTDRAGKVLSFDSSGDPNITQELGVWKGNWAASTAYVLRDLVKDSSNSNVYICVTAHTSSGSTPVSSNTDVAKWALLIDAAAAATSATASATSASAAASSATAAASSATSAATSAATATTQATTATAKAVLTAADVVLTAADVVSAEADKVQTGLDRVATAADKVATNADVVLTAADVVSAAASASTATTQATNAATSATTATTQASAASTSATNAATSATSAATQATTATTQATAAAASATAAAASADAFDDTYLGAKSSDPTVDNDGDALTAGDLYYNTTSSELKYYNGSAWTAIVTYTHPNHSGDVVSSGDGAMTIQVDAVDIAMLSATGTASATTFLRGDNTWVVPTDTNTDTKWDGGTTGLTAATGRTSLGLVIGTDVQAYSANTAITTADTSWTGSQRATLVVDNDGSFDMNGGNNFKCTPAGNFTLTFTNITDGQSGYILLVNTGGHTVSAHANSKVDANLLATVTAAGTYLISYLSDGTNVYLTNSAIYT